MSYATEIQFNKTSTSHRGQGARASVEQATLRVRFPDSTVGDQNLDEVSECCVAPGVEGCRDGLHNIPTVRRRWTLPGKERVPMP